jgi:hypothetical protein
MRQGLNQLFKAIRIHIIVFFTFMFLCWFYFGLGFGAHPIDAGDDWIGIANSSFNFYPFCIGNATNYLNPWRPFLPTAGCIVVRLFGASPAPLYVMGTLLYALTAWAWFMLLQKAFALPHWLAFAAGILFLSIPDFSTPFLLSSQLRIVGSAEILIGTTLFLYFWDDMRSWYLALASLGFTLLGLLTYEVIISLWIIGLPLWLLRKEKRITRKWIFATVLIEGLFALYLFWRFFILPQTYVATTILGGAGASLIDFSPLNVLRQLASLYILIYFNMNQAIHLLLDVFQRTDWLQVLGECLLLTVLTTLVMHFMARLELPSLASNMGRSSRTTRRLFLVFFILVPILGFPFLLSTIPILTVGYISFGTSLAVSLGWVGFCLGARIPRTTIWLVVAGTLLTVFLGTMSSSTYAYAQQQTANCDFATRFVKRFPQLPPNKYIVIRTKTQLDPWILSTFMGYLYYAGQQDSTHYDLGRMGYLGYFFYTDAAAQTTPEGITTHWGNVPQLVTLHPFSSLPVYIPNDQAILVDYTQNDALVPISVAPSITPDKTATPDVAAARLAPFCPAS